LGGRIPFRYGRVDRRLSDVEQMSRALIPDIQHIRNREWGREVCGRCVGDASLAA
jgi:hypothetical protein